MPGVLAVAALTPGILKHRRTVNINHLHCSLGLVYDEILRQTAKQHAPQGPASLGRSRYVIMFVANGRTGGVRRAHPPFRQSGEAFRGEQVHSGQRNRVHEYDLRGILQQPRDPARANRTTSTAERACRERYCQDFHSYSRMFASRKPGTAPTQLWDELVARVTSMGI